MIWSLNGQTACVGKNMRRIGFLMSILVIVGCAAGPEKERLEAIENRLQATEFQMASLAETEHRVTAIIQRKEETYGEWFTLIESTRESMADLETRILSLEQGLAQHEHRLGASEAWIREKQKEEEKERKFKTPDGTIGPEWKQLNDKCGLDKAGEAQTTLNILVRIDRYMSDFPVHHPVELAEKDPLTCMTSNLADRSAVLRDAYKDRELAILKGRDQWLGYRIDRSWETRPERGECAEACCDMDQVGAWSCKWGWEGGRWECEYDVEGWRNYRRRWYRRCDYVPGTKDFYSKPYLMQKMDERKLATPEELYCVVDLVWENRIYCLSHSQYPVMQIRLPDDPENPMPKPNLPRFTIIKIRNWDVLYKDEWTSTWVVKGALESGFAGQLSGLAIDVVQEPQCCPASNPLEVVIVLQELNCIPESARGDLLESIAIKHGFEGLIDYETQRAGMEDDPEWRAKLDKVRAAGCQQAE